VPKRMNFFESACDSTVSGCSPLPDRWRTLHVGSHEDVRHTRRSSMISRDPRIIRKLGFSFCVVRVTMVAQIFAGWIAHRNLIETVELRSGNG